MVHEMSTAQIRALVDAIMIKRGMLYRRNVADAAGIKESTLSGWYKGGTLPKNSIYLNKLVELLGDDDEAKVTLQTILAIKNNSGQSVSIGATGDLTVDVTIKMLCALIPALRYIAEDKTRRIKFRKAMGKYWVIFARLVLALVDEDDFNKIKENYPSVFTDQL